MDQPLVSVLLPVRNEEKFLHKALSSVLAQDYTQLEVLVIDGDSDDRTVEIIREFQARDQRVKLVHNPGRWQVKALNIGIKAAQGKFILRVDGHITIAPDYVRRALGYLAENPEIENLGGPVIAVGNTPMGRAIAKSYSSSFAVPSPMRVIRQNAYTDTVFPGMWRRELFDRIGLFNESLRVNEDYEFNYRTRKAGGKIWIATDLYLEYYCRESVTALWQQYYRYGYGKLLMLRLFPGSVRARHLIAPLFVAALVGGSFLGTFLRPIRWLWLLMISAYSLLAWGEAYRQSSQDRSLFWRLPIVFITIHTAWGLGFWRGLAEVMREVLFERKTP